VGETGSIRQRLQQHRNNYNNKEGKSLISSVIIIKVNNKSQSRSMETFLIKELKKNGFNIEHDSDESHSLFGSNEEYKLT
jgi:predicted transposase YdaD